MVPFRDEAFPCFFESTSMKNALALVLVTTFVGMAHVLIKLRQDDWLSKELRKKPVFPRVALVL